MQEFWAAVRPALPARCYRCDGDHAVAVPPDGRGAARSRPKGPQQRPQPPRAAPWARTCCWSRPCRRWSSPARMRTGVWPRRAGSGRRKPPRRCCGSRPCRARWRAWWPYYASPWPAWRPPPGPCCLLSSRPTLPEARHARLSYPGQGGCDAWGSEAGPL